MPFEYPFVAHFGDLAPPRLRPLLWRRLQRLHLTIGDFFDLANLERLLDEHGAELWRTPALAALGHDLLRPGRTLEERRWGCIWLTHFPAPETVQAMRALLLDEAAPPALRSQAAWTLGYRQEREREGGFSWPAEVADAADRALAEAFVATLRAPSAPAAAPAAHAGLAALPLFAGALRAVDHPALDAAFLAWPLEAAPAIECHASPALALALLERLPAIGTEHAPRILRLIGATLGGDCAARLLAYAGTAPLAEKCEAIFAALAVAPDLARPAAAAHERTLAFPALWQARTRWHLENPGAFPTVRALRCARATALIPPVERAARCAAAAADFAALADKDGLQWDYLLELWRQVARGAAAVAPAEVIRCVEAAPAGTTGGDAAFSTLERSPFLVAPYLEALAAAGRFRDLAEAGARHGAADLAAWLLARRSRPFLALAARRRCRAITPEAAAGQALALFLCGRPDLALRSLAVEPPPAGDGGQQPFPSPDDCWRMNREPHRAPLLRALADRSLPALCALAAPPPPEAEPDSFDFAELAAAERSLSRDLAGAPVTLLGSFADRAAVEVWLDERGAQLVSGPFARCRFVVAGALDGAADLTHLARLQAQGATVLHAESLFPCTVEPSVPPLPYRACFLPPVATFPADADGLEWAAAVLLDTTLFQHLVRHSRVSLTDPDDQRWDLGDDVMVNAEHEQFEERLAEKFRSHRRDEVLWFELALDPGQRVTARLRTRRHDGALGDFPAIGGDSLGGMIEGCVGAWLQAAGLDPAPQRMEPFTAEQFLGAAQEIEAFAEARRAEQPHDVSVPEALTVPFCHALFSAFGELPPAEFVYSREPENPWALREHFMKLVHEGPTKRDEIRRAILLAPQYAKPYLSMFGEDVTSEEHLSAFSTAALLMPGNSFANQQYADALLDAGRYEEALRWSERAVGLYAGHFSGHMTAQRALLNCGRAGEELGDSDGRVGFLEGLVEQERLEAESPDLCIVRLNRSDVYLDVGRLEEAIAMRREALQAAKAGRDKWPRMFSVLDEWESSPGVLANCFAREGYHRGDFGRALAGWGQAAPLEGPDVAKLVESLLALGKDDLALLAVAHFQPKNISRRWEPRAAAAKALILGGRLAQALEHLQVIQLRFPQAKFEAEVNRVLRLAAARPLAEWEAALQERLDKGAQRLARMLARDCADFVPGAAQSAVVAQAQALAGTGAIAFDPQWLAGLKEAIGIDASRVDVFFAPLDQPLPEGGDALALADRLAAGWLEAVPGEGDDAIEGRLLLYLAGHALCRYLAATTQAPSPVTGGLRQVATEAVFLLSRFAGRYPDAMLAPLLAAIEACGSAGAPGPNQPGAVGGWVLDSWLLRLERALDLEANHGAHLDHLLDPLPRVGSFLRGDERVAFEYRLAKEAAQDPQRGVQARKLLERCLRAFGGNAAAQYSDLADLTLPPALALDAHWTALAAAPTAAMVAMNLGRALLAAGKTELAFEALVKALGFAPKDLRKRYLDELQPLWAQAGMPVPFDFAGASSRGSQLLQAGDFAGCLPYLRWCDAIDPNNKTTLRNLGIAQARLGNAFDALAAFAEADPTQGPNWTGQALREAQKWPEAVLAYRYASLSFRTIDEWLALGGAAWFAEDDETAAFAYGRARTLGQLDKTQLHSYATVLNATGRHGEALDVAKELLAVAGADPTYASTAAHATARALLGLGRAAEALPHAQKAAKQNPLPDNAAEFAETVARCQRGEPWPVKPLRAEGAAERAAEALEGGDAKAALAVAAGDESWKALRIALAAAEHRFESENGQPVADAALEAFAPALERTGGQTDPDAALARLRALRLRENARVRIDPPPPLGARLTRERFDQLLSERGSKSPKAPPKLDVAKAQAQAAAAMAKIAGGAGGDPDPVVFPGSKVAKLSDYVKLMKGMQTGNMMGALQAAGLDMGAYAQVAAQWGQKMATDPTLMVKMQQLMMKP